MTPPAVRAAILVMARAPRPGASKPRLREELGDERAAELDAALIRRTAAWAVDAAPAGAAYLAFDPPGAGDELAALVPAGMTLFPQRGEGRGRRLAEATSEVFARRAEDPRPRGLLVSGTAVPALRREHALAAATDLADGCDVTIGPSIDGGFWLVGLARAMPDLFLSVPDDGWDGAEAFRHAFEAAMRAGLSVGMLRTERPISGPRDREAWLADPLLPAELRGLLR